MVSAILKKPYLTNAILGLPYPIKSLVLPLTQLLAACVPNYTMCLEWFDMALLHNQNYPKALKGWDSSYLF